ncbi:unnamed protein product [Choristocarpus tenellus]
MQLAVSINVVWCEHRKLQSLSLLFLPSRPLIRNPASSVPAMGCAVGAWLGAVPLILDWNEPWQAWPLTVALGGLLGFSAGIILFLAKWIVSLGARWRRGDQQAKLS